MKIVLIVDPLNEKEPAGLGRSVLEFAKTLMKERPGDEFVLITKNEIEPQRYFDTDCNIVETICLHGKEIWKTDVLNARKDIKLLISFTPVLPLKFTGKSIVFIHDFAYLKFEKLTTRLSLWLLHFIVLHKATRICSVSQESLRIAARAFFVKRNKFTVINNGFEHLSSSNGGNAESIECPNKEQFLAVGVIKERKNTLKIVKAFELFLKNHRSYKLLVVGKDDSAYAERVKHYVHTKKLDHAVIFNGYVEDDKLNKIYLASTALVYPSLVEGFGFPVLEAMQKGLPVITSRGGALEEVAGKAAVLVDPYSEKSIADGMNQVLAVEKRNTLITSGYKNIERFSWAKAGLDLSREIDVIYHG